MRNIRNFIKGIGGILLVGYATFCNPAYALTQKGVSVTLIGSEGNGNQAYIGISPDTNLCLNGGVYFTNPSEVSKTLSVAMAAKLSMKTVRIDFNQPGGLSTLCYGYSIYIE